MKFFHRSEPESDPVKAVAARDYNRAIEIYREWTTKDPARAAQWQKKLAEVLVLAGRRAEAVKAYLTAAALLAREDRMVQVLALYRTALRLDPANVEVKAKIADIAAESQPAVQTQSTGPAGMTIRTRLRRKVPLFSQFEREELTGILEVMNFHRLRPGKVVFNQGDPGESIFIVVQGEVALAVRGSDSENVELERIGEGGFFGEVSALNRTPRNVSAICTADTELLELTRDYLEALAIANPRIWDVLEQFQRTRQVPAGI
jgi:tetratricopeptide (TPR) repeat protein